MSHNKRSFQTVLLHNFLTELQILIGAGSLILKVHFIARDAVCFQIVRHALGFRILILRAIQSTCQNKHFKLAGLVILKTQLQPFPQPGTRVISPHSRT
ncbi:hypothetical protein D3C78_1657510 [compost metagenome]